MVSMMIGILAGLVFGMIVGIIVGIRSRPSPQPPPEPSQEVSDLITIDYFYPWLERYGLLQKAQEKGLTFVMGDLLEAIKREGEQKVVRDLSYRMDSIQLAVEKEAWEGLKEECQRLLPEWKRISEKIAPSEENV